MAKHPQKLFNQFSVKIDELSSIINKVVGNTSLTLGEQQKIVEGVFIQMVTCFESHTEELFFGLLEGKIARKSLSVCLAFSIRPSTYIRNLLLLDRDYFEWLPIDKTIDRAGNVFIDGKPFSKISGLPLKGELAGISKIRNAIAHSSEFAQQSFQRIICNSRLLPHEQTPGGYLLSKPGMRNERQIDIICTNMKAVFHLWCTP